MISAQDLTRTRICAAHACDQDAEPGRELCWRCLRKPLVKRHELPDVYAGPTARCSAHAEFFPDESAFRPEDQFAACKQKASGRRPECRSCSAARRRLWREQRTPEQRARDARKQRERLDRQRLELQALRDTR